MTQSGRPVWLLDIDGVINALSRGPVQDSWPSEQWVQRVVDAEIPGSGRMVLPIFAAQPVLDFVTRVVASGAAEVVWHSTWREAAATALAPALGIAAMPVSVAPEWPQRPARVWWKVPAARRVVESGRRLVWTDDDISVVPDQVADLVEHAGTLLIAPDPQTGLTAEHLHAIAGFIGLDDADRGSSEPKRSLFSRLLRS